MTIYNGHKNYNHWNVALWINNDQCLYWLAKDAIHLTTSRAAAVAYFLEYVGSDKTPDGVPYSKSSVRAAMVGL